MSSERTMEPSDDSSDELSICCSGELSICSTISGDTHRDQKTAARRASLGWTENKQAMLDAVWSARTDVDTAKETLDKANQSLEKAVEVLKQATQGITKFKAKFVPPRSVQSAKANYQQAKSNASMAKMRLKHCQSILDRKRGEGCKLGVDVRPVPETLHVRVSRRGSCC